ncbi:MAG: NAD(P)-dependent oxidoreductase [Planctomycetota bacterium]
MNVLIADKFEDQGIAGLRDNGCTVDFQPDLTTDGLADALNASKAEVLIVRSTKIPAEVIDAADSLRLIIRAGAGFDTIDTKHAGSRGVPVCNCPGTNSAAVAELVMGHILAFDRRIPDQTADLRKGVWNKKQYSKLGRGVKGKVLGIVGVGAIGKLVARRAIAFEMTVLYHDIVPCEELDNHPDAKRVELEEVLKNADVVTLHVPAIEATRHLMNEKTLGMMKPTALLVNTTRGSVVDQKALAAALKNGTIAGAALDVYENEPAAGDKEIQNELLDLPNFQGTHHVGASTEQAQLAVAEMTVEIVKQFKATGEAMNCVNKDAMAASRI